MEFGKPWFPKHMTCFREEMSQREHTKLHFLNTEGLASATNPASARARPSVGRPLIAQPPGELNCASAPSSPLASPLMGAASAPAAPMPQPASPSAPASPLVEPAAPLGEERPGACRAGVAASRCARGKASEHRCRSFPASSKPAPPATSREQGRRRASRRPQSPSAPPPFFQCPASAHAAR